tara:strand:+ start:139 stop:318 length:180 start_codon:yes stop_codon:yes gene_type:complete
MESPIKNLIIGIFFYICEKLGFCIGYIHAKIINNYYSYKTIGNKGIEKFKENYAVSKNM